MGPLPSATRTSNFIARSNFADALPNAVIDDFRIWAVGRSPAQIGANLGSPLIGSEPGLKLYYQFNNTSGTVTPNAAVATGAAYDGTLINSPASVPGPP
jgi:hypothetical protein